MEQKELNERYYQDSELDRSECRQRIGVRLRDRKKEGVMTARSKSTPQSIFGGKECKGAKMK